MDRLACAWSTRGLVSVSMATRRVPKFGIMGALQTPRKQNVCASPLSIAPIHASLGAQIFKPLDTVLGT